VTKTRCRSIDRRRSTQKPLHRPVRGAKRLNTHGIRNEESLRRSARVKITRRITRRGDSRATGVWPERRSYLQAAQSFQYLRGLESQTALSSARACASRVPRYSRVIFSVSPAVIRVLRVMVNRKRGRDRRKNSQLHSASQTSPRPSEQRSRAKTRPLERLESSTLCLWEHRSYVGRSLWSVLARQFGS